MKKREMSKKIVAAIQVIFSLSMVASYVLPILFEYVAEASLKMFQTTATLTGSVLIGYYGKAGFENYDKNKKLFGFEEDENENEGSNG